MLQLLIRRARRDKQALAVPCRQASDDPCSSDRAMADGNDILELGLKNAIMERLALYYTIK